MKTQDFNVNTFRKWEHFTPWGKQSDFECL